MYPDQNLAAEKVRFQQRKRTKPGSHLSIAVQMACSSSVTTKGNLTGLLLLTKIGNLAEMNFINSSWEDSSFLSYSKKLTGMNGAP